MFLGPKVVQRDFERQGPHVEPRRQLRGTRREISIRKEEVGDDGLRPGRARLVGCRDDDVIVARLEVVPPGTVEVMALIDVGTFRQIRHGVASL